MMQWICLIACYFAGYLVRNEPIGTIVVVVLLVSCACALYDIRLLLLKEYGE